MKLLETNVAAVFALGRLPYQHCPGCGHNQAMTRPFCVSCLRPDPDWHLACGLGSVVASTTLHRAPTPEWKTRLPYSLALIDLVEGIHIMALCAPDLQPGDAATLLNGGKFDLPYFERTKPS